jgi:hypothetical protein
MTRTDTALSTQVESLTLTPAELTALLQGEGMAEAGTSFPRVKFTNGMLIASDTGEMWVYNPAKPADPMATVRIMGLPDEYFVYWIDDEIATAIDCPASFIGKPSKKYLKPDPTRQVWESDELYDAIRAAGFKSKWAADALIQFMPPDGTLKGDEPIYSLTLATTSVIEFKGTSKNPEAGSIPGNENFVRKVAKFAAAQYLETTTEKPTKFGVESAVKDAMTSLKNGGVVAELRTARAENKELKQSWMVLVWDPIHIEPVDSPSLELTDGSVEQSEDVPL